MSWVSDGQTSGSPGSGNQMEAVQIKTAEFPSTYHIDYQAHVSYIGWQGWVSDGQTAGTTGQGKAIEAIQIKLRGFPSNYHVKYRAYIQNSGWQGWVSDGGTAGTTGQGKAIEALAVIVYADPLNISSINPTQIGAGIFDLTINGSNFDSGAVDQIFWKATGAFVGQGTILSRSSTRLVVREFMEGTNPGTYVVKVKNSDGQISSGIDLEIVNQPPEAKITMTSGGQTAYENETLNLSVVPGGTAQVDFSASRSSDPDGSVTSYQWCINGQPEYTTRDCDHDFPAGTHQILLKVWDNQGAQGAVGASIIIEEIPAPHITSISPTKIGAGTFDLTINGSNFDNDGAVDKIFWKAEDRFVGQGTILSRSSTRLVVREFMEGTSPGTYVVRVENPDGQISNGIDLEIINQPPVAKFSMTSQGQTVYEDNIFNLSVAPGGKAHVNFSASRSYDPDGSVSSYQWYIKGQPEYTTRDFERDFPAGTHQIRLDVWDNQDAQGAVGASIVIEEAPAPHIISISPTKIEDSIFDLTINGSNFDNEAVDKIFWKATMQSVGQGTVLSQNSTQLVVREFMEGAEPGIYVVKVENPDGQISNGIDLEIISENNIVYLDNGIVRVGVDLDQGGAITEIIHDGYNLIDTNDPGRYIQVSLWERLENENAANPDWNPVQAGDTAKNLNPVTEHSSDSNSIYTKARGINWLNTGTDPQWLDVNIEQWVTLEDEKVKVRYRVTHFGSDEHILWHQEFPCAYLRTELSDSITYSGDNPWESDQVEHIGIIPGQSKFVMPTEHWVGFVKADDFGLTI
ncbi:MAG: hypothetical protein K8R52_05190 [Bacteroidales bacterium]|nr:hypothetical protein [Bacteroidales bacterium]